MRIRSVIWYAALTPLVVLATACGGGSDTAPPTTPVTPTPPAPVSVATVDVTPAAPSLTVGATQQLTATPKDASGNTLSGRSVSWSTASSTVATVSASGLITGVAAGTTTATATVDGKTGTAAITVTPIPVATVTITPATASLFIGGTTALAASARDATGATLTGRAVTWSSSAIAIATVSATGTVTGVSAGSATITATVEGKTATATITVAPVPVATVAVSPTAPTVFIGGTQQMTASARDSAGGVFTGRPVAWTSSATTIATISTLGVVTGIAEGTATITATVEGKTASTTVTVSRAPIATITLSPTSPTVWVDSAAQLTATLRDANGTTLTGRTVTWSSSATTIAQVNSSGLVGGIAPGSATITATAEGKSASVTVTVSRLLSFRMYYSTSLNGPWQFKTAIVNGGDAFELVDPSPVLMPDGRILIYYLMNNVRQGDPSASQPNSSWKMGVAESTDDGESFTQRGTAISVSSAITDPFPMVLADGRIRMLYAQTIGTTSYVYSATSSDATGLTFPYTLDAGARATGASIPGALRIGNTFYLYTCDNGISYSTSTDGLNFSSTRTVALQQTAGITCDPSPITVGTNSYAMVYKTRPPGVQNPRSDTTYMATSTNGTTWTRISTPVGAGSVPGLVRDRNGVFRVYVVYFPPR